MERRSKHLWYEFLIFLLVYCFQIYNAMSVFLKIHHVKGELLLYLCVYFFMKRNLLLIQLVRDSQPGKCGNSLFQSFLRSFIGRTRVNWVSEKFCFPWWSPRQKWLATSFERHIQEGTGIFIQLSLN